MIVLFLKCLLCAKPFFASPEKANGLSLWEHSAWIRLLLILCLGASFFLTQKIASFCSTLLLVWVLSTFLFSSPS